MLGFGNAAFGGGSEGSGGANPPVFLMVDPLWGATITNDKTITVQLSIPGQLGAFNAYREIPGGGMEGVYVQGIGEGLGYVVSVSGGGDSYLIAITRNSAWPDATLTLNLQAVDLLGQVTNRVITFTISDPMAEDSSRERLNRGLN